jgi:hypothetical protein
VLAIAAAGNLSKPMLLRVPGTSTIALNKFGDDLAQKGVKSYQVVTKIAFDISKPYPALTFKALGFTSPEMHAEITKQRNSDMVKVIVGEKALSALSSATAEDDEATADAEYVPPPAVEAPKVEKKAAAKPAPAVEDDDDLPTKPVQETKVEAPKPTPKKETAKKVEVADEGIDSVLGDLDFDD